MQVFWLDSLLLNLNNLANAMLSVATVMTDVFRKNEINLLRKFAKIMRIFDNIDDSKNRRVI